MAAMKEKEREMKQVKEDAATQKRERIQERRRKAEEKDRLDRMAQKVSTLLCHSHTLFIFCIR